jgi:16S rRNA (uracil1498-N3)-methyltransferase
VEEETEDLELATVIIHDPFAAGSARRTSPGGGTAGHRAPPLPLVAQIASILSGEAADENCQFAKEVDNREMNCPDSCDFSANCDPPTSRPAGDFYRFYVPDLRLQADRGAVQFPADQAHHALQVLRLGGGTEIVLFDGGGTWAHATLGQVGKKGAALTAALSGLLHLDPPPKIALTIATAVPKGERAEWLIEQASQLNVSTIAWLAADRGVVKPREGGGKMEKWRRLAIESAKQCGRAHLLEVQEPVSLQEVLRNALDAALRILWLDPREGGESIYGARVDKKNVIALVGPEGGWSDREFALLESHAAGGRLTRVRLTPTVLRIETACAAIAAVLMSG